MDVVGLRAVYIFRVSLDAFASFSGIGIVSKFSYKMFAYCPLLTAIQHPSFVIIRSTPYFSSGIRFDGGSYQVRGELDFPESQYVAIVLQIFV